MTGAACSGRNAAAGKCTACDCEFTSTWCTPQVCRPYLTLLRKNSSSAVPPLKSPANPSPLLRNEMQIGHAYDSMSEKETGLSACRKRKIASETTCQRSVTSFPWAVNLALRFCICRPPAEKMITWQIPKLNGLLIGRRLHT